MEIDRQQLLGNDRRYLQGRILKALEKFDSQNGYSSIITKARQGGSAVMFLVGNCHNQDQSTAGPCLILNKRSDSVRQPGDLCFPGGGISPLKDRLLSRLLGLPRSPFKRWALLTRWRPNKKTQTKALTLFLAVALREAWEEMHLNPLRVNFLGFLPQQHLVVYDRCISPMVGWVRGDQSFKPNWEVQRIVRIPLISLLDDQRYGRFRPMIGTTGSFATRSLHDDQFPCYIHRDARGRELLWGVTFRMVADFLKIVFEFKVPDMDRLPKVSGILSPHYPQGFQPHR